MRFLFTLLLAAASSALYSQRPTIEEVIKKMQPSGILPVRKPFTNLPAAIVFHQRGTPVKDSVVYLPASPPDPLYFPEGDERLLSTLSVSVKNCLVDLERRKKKSK